MNNQINPEETNQASGWAVFASMLVASATLLTVQLMLINLAGPQLDQVYAPASVQMNYPVI